MAAAVKPDRLLVLGGVLSAMASALHVGILIVGASWYRFFGADEQMAQLAEAGNWYPPTITACIALALAIWALYAFAGAGVIGRLPLMRVALVAIPAIYLLRGLAIIPLLIRTPSGVTAFWWWSSLICLGYGIVHLIGVHRNWARL